MTLDERGRRAADGLRRSVSSQVDGARVWTELQAGPAETPTPSGSSRWQRPLVGVAAMVAICLAATVAVVAQHADDRTHTEAGRDPREKIGLALPAAPIDGKASWRLPVVATPQHGVHDGDSVSVIGRGFEPGEQVGVVLCASEADTENAGVDACQLSSPGATFDLVAGYGNADDEGIAIVDIKAQRFIETPKYGRVDCQSAPERCLLGMGAVSNYDRSGGSYVLFAGSPPFAAIHASVAPKDDLAPGQSVIVSLTGGVPGRNVAVYQCMGERCALRTVTRASDEGAAVAGIQVFASVRDERGEVECDGRCTVQVRGYGGPPGATSAPQPAPMRITFDPTAPDVPTPPPTTVMPPSTTRPTPPTVSAPSTYVVPIGGGATIVIPADTGSVPAPATPPATQPADPESPPSSGSVMSVTTTGTAESTTVP